MFCNNANRKLRGSVAPGRGAKANPPGPDQSKCEQRSPSRQTEASIVKNVVCLNCSCFDIVFAFNLQLCFYCFSCMQTIKWAIYAYSPVCVHVDNIVVKGTCPHGEPGDTSVFLKSAGQHLKLKTVPAVSLPGLPACSCLLPSGCSLAVVPCCLFSPPLASPPSHPANQCRASGPCALSSCWF